MLLTEIAQKARVSPATVSRAINQPHLVATDSLARIRAVMKQHNYMPAPLNRRRGPKRGRSFCERLGRQSAPPRSRCTITILRNSHRIAHDRMSGRLVFRRCRTRIEATQSWPAKTLRDVG